MHNPTRGLAAEMESSVTAASDAAPVRGYAVVCAEHEVHEDRMRRMLAIFDSGGEHVPSDAAGDVGNPYRPAFVEVPGVEPPRPLRAPEPTRPPKRWQAALRACGVDGVEVWEDRDSHSTVLTQLCAWCGRRVTTRVADAAICAAPSAPHVVAIAIAIAALDRARHKHLAARGCATAGHDPGDEGPGEGAARLMWRSAP